MNNLRKEFHSKIRDAYLKDNKICECEKCKRNKSKTSLHVHHRFALADGGTNEYSNLIALCTRCHDEWHSIEGYNYMSFEQWLEIPPYFVLINVFHQITDLPGNLSTSRIKRIATVEFNLYKKFGDKSETNIKDERRKKAIKNKIEKGELDGYGRPRALDFDKFSNEYKRVLVGDIKPFECMKLLGLTKATYYRYVKEYSENLK